MLRAPLPPAGYLEIVGKMDPERARRECANVLTDLYDVIGQKRPDHPLLKERININSYSSPSADWYSLGVVLDKLATEALRLCEKVWTPVPTPIKDSVWHPNRY
jgi:hypothetical protein